jgi:hypothetical protein
MAAGPIAELADLRVANQRELGSSSEFDEYILELNKGLEPLPTFFFDNRWPTAETLTFILSELKKCFHKFSRVLTFPSSEAHPRLKEFLGKGEDIRQDLHELVAALEVYLRDHSDFDQSLSGDMSPSRQREANKALQDDHVEFVTSLERFRDRIRDIAA